MAGSFCHEGTKARSFVSSGLRGSTEESGSSEQRAIKGRSALIAVRATKISARPILEKEEATMTYTEKLKERLDGMPSEQEGGVVDADAATDR